MEDKEEKLDDIERDAVRVVAAKYTKRAVWTAAASLVAWAGAIWFRDWRFVGIALILFFVASAIYVVSWALTAPSNEGRVARIIHTAQRAKTAKADRERKKREDLEREFGMRD